MRKLLVTLTLLISAVSFGQINFILYEKSFPNGSTSIIANKIKKAEGLHQQGSFNSAINIYTDIIDTYNIDPLVKHNTMYYRANAYKEIGYTKSACQDIMAAFNIYMTQVQYYNYPSLTNIPKDKPTYINIGWGGYLYIWGCISKKTRNLMNRQADKTFKTMEKTFRKYSHNLNW